MCNERATLNARCSVKRVWRCGGNEACLAVDVSWRSVELLCERPRKESTSNGWSRRLVRGGVGNGMTGGLGAGALQVSGESVRVEQIPRDVRIA